MNAKDSPTPMPQLHIRRDEKTQQLILSDSEGDLWYVDEDVYTRVFHHLEDLTFDYYGAHMPDTPVNRAFLGSRL